MTNFDATIEKFSNLLDEKGIEYIKLPIFDGMQWRFSHLPGDVVIHSGSYNSHRGYVESYEMPWDEGDVTSCTPEEMVRRIAGEEYNEEEEYEYTFEDLLYSCMKLDNLRS